eukprot:4747638-Prymnesium_polylepis.1
MHRRTDHSTVSRRRRRSGTSHTSPRACPRAGRLDACCRRKAPAGSAHSHSRDEVVPRPIPDGAAVRLVVERVEHQP